MQYLTNSR